MHQPVRAGAFFVCRSTHKHPQTASAMATDTMYHASETDTLSRSRMARAAALHHDSRTDPHRHRLRLYHGTHTIGHRNGYRWHALRLYHVRAATIGQEHPQRARADPQTASAMATGTMYHAKETDTLSNGYRYNVPCERDRPPQRARMARAAALWSCAYTPTIGHRNGTQTPSARATGTIYHRARDSEPQHMLPAQCTTHTIGTGCGSTMVHTHHRSAHTDRTQERLQRASASTMVHRPSGHRNGTHSPTGCGSMLCERVHIPTGTPTGAHRSTQGTGCSSMLCMRVHIPTGTATDRLSGHR